MYIINYTWCILYIVQCTLNIIKVMYIVLGTLYTVYNVHNVYLVIWIDDQTNRNKLYTQIAFLLAITYIIKALFVYRLYRGDLKIYTLYIIILYTLYMWSMIWPLHYIYSAVYYTLNYMYISCRAATSNIVSHSEMSLYHEHYCIKLIPSLYSITQIS